MWLKMFPLCLLTLPLLTLGSPVPTHYGPAKAAFKPAAHTYNSVKKIGYASGGGFPLIGGPFAPGFPALGGLGLAGLGGYGAKLSPYGLLGAGQSAGKSLGLAAGGLYAGKLGYNPLSMMYPLKAYTATAGGYLNPAYGGMYPSLGKYGMYPKGGSGALLGKYAAGAGYLKQPLGLLGGYGLGLPVAGGYSLALYGGKAVAGYAGPVGAYAGVAPVTSGYGSGINMLGKALTPYG